MNFVNFFAFILATLIIQFSLQHFGFEFGPDYYGGMIAGCLLMVFLDFFPIWK